MKPRRNPLGDMNIVGENITRIRKDKGIKQKDYLAMLQAEGMDINGSGLSKIEGQTRMVSDKELRILAKCLHVDLNELIE